MTKPSTVRLSRSQVRSVEDATQPSASPRDSRGPDFWREAVPLYPSRGRRPAYLRLDHEVMDWFAARKGDPHAGINAVLRAYIERRRADGQETA
jgi:uncharacterized protein (DUF4415 family)